MKRCNDCRDGDHENYDEDIQLAIITEPENGRLVKRALLCGEHREAYADDGYDVVAVK